MGPLLANRNCIHVTATFTYHQEYMAERSRIEEKEKLRRGSIAIGPQKSSGKIFQARMSKMDMKIRVSEMCAYQQDVQFNFLGPHLTSDLVLPEHW